ncbi:hypothetical protein TB2_034599 [Malus domestica]
MLICNLLRSTEDTKRELRWEEEEEERAKVDVWKYVFGFVEIVVVKCAIELGIADAIESHGSPMTLLELLSVLSCDHSHLYRIMRVLVHLKIFKEKPTELGPKGYAQTPLSKRLLKSGENSVAAFILLESSLVMLTPWHSLSARLQGNSNPSFEAVHEEDVWSFATANPDHSKLINDSMACDARVVVPAVIESCLEVFKGLETIVGVGGGDGTTLRLLVETWSVDSRHQLIFLMLCLLLRSVIGLRMSEVTFFFLFQRLKLHLSCGFFTTEETTTVFVS